MVNVTLRGTMNMQNTSGTTRNFVIGVSVYNTSTLQWVDLPWKKIVSLAHNAQSTYNLEGVYNLPLGTYNARFAVWEAWSGGTHFMGDYYIGGSLTNRIVNFDIPNAFSVTSGVLAEIIGTPSVVKL